MDGRHGLARRTRLALAMLLASALTRCDGACGAGGTLASIDAGASSGQPLVQVTLDGLVVARVGREELARRVTVEQLLRTDGGPRAELRRLVARAPGGRQLEIHAVDERYRDMDFVLSWDEAHGATLGLFRQIDDSMPAHVKAALAAPHMQLVSVTSIEIQSAPPAPAPASNDTLRVLVDGAEARALEAAAVTALPRVVPPGQGPGEGKRRFEGHPLRDVVGLVIAPGRVVKVVAVGAASKDVLAIDGATLRGDQETPILRRTQRGQWDLRVWAAGDAGALSRLRDVQRLEIETSPAP